MDYLFLLSNLENIIWESLIALILMMRAATK